ncbi:peptidoglycan DD-metalloendopeptidase family protein [Calderihabitans maritimus]|uniref:Peptidase M23 n=1 Tax=Calderihabitans maritimus TaxID=1246530 RepID=A0A1Z5HW76_9FIRM|nr:M23 family metallopeptidase [Calderihabitans maritimus]GAW93793.1 peptidase M23 [Calderihabitans maritimus]
METTFKSIARIIILLVFFSLLLPQTAKAEMIPIQLPRASDATKKSEASTEIVSRINERTRLYRVKKGDTLWSIAQKYNLDLDLIVALNDLPADATIYAGQYLVLPYEPASVYVVKPGDTLWDIARIHQVPVDLIVQRNDLGNPELLQVGQEIFIPTLNRSQRVVRRSQERLSRSTWGSLYWPLRGTITSPYGKRGRGFHHGIDIAGDYGEPIRAAEEGEVIFSGWYNSIYGYTVIINHGSGRRTLYAHNSRNMVRKGERVKAGQVIARVGSSGRSTGPHLHFEVYINDRTVNPLIYLSR